MADNSQNSVFLNLTRDEVLEKIGIDERVREPFKRVMERIQKYFNTHGYNTKVNYEEMINNHLIPDKEIEKFRETIKDSDEFNKYYNELVSNVERVQKELNIKLEAVDKEKLLDSFLTNKNYNTGLKIVVSDSSIYNPETNTINISASLLNSKDFDSELCKQFIHFLTMCGEKEYGNIANQLKPICYEAMTEMLTKEIMTGSKTNLDKFTEILDLINKISGVNDYSDFLMRKLDQKYDNQWLLFFEEAQDLFDKFHGTLKEEDLVKLQRKAIDNMSYELMKNSNNVVKYTEMLVKLKNSPTSEYDKAYINNFIEKSIQAFMEQNNINNEKAKENIKELIKVQEKLDLYNGKNVYEVKMHDGKSVAFDSKGTLYMPNGNIVNPNDKDAPNYIDDNNILYFFSGDERIDIDLNTIDFGERKEKLLANKEKLTEVINKIISESKELQNPYGVDSKTVKDVLERALSDNPYLGFEKEKAEIEKVDYADLPPTKKDDDTHSNEYMPSDMSKEQIQEQAKEQRRKAFYEKAKELGLDKENVDLEKLFEEQEQIRQKEQEKDYGLSM